MSDPMSDDSESINDDREGMGDDRSPTANGLTSITLTITGVDFRALLKAYRYEDYQDLTLKQFALGVFRLGLQDEREDKGNERLLNNLRIR